MKTKITETHVKIWLSANDTYEWAQKLNRRWACSTLADHKVFAEFDSNGLLDLAVDGKPDFDCDGTEFSAMCSDFLRNRLPKDHVCYEIVVGQFVRKE